MISTSEKVGKVQEKHKSMEELQHAHSVHDWKREEQRLQHAADQKQQSLQSTRDRATIQVLDAQGFTHLTLEGYERHQRQVEEDLKHSQEELVAHKRHEQDAHSRREQHIQEIKEKQNRLQHAHFHPKSP